ncbi:WGxxGxxG-CTERM domain-containing protein [Paenibacillus albicereus]|uniref:WGxxGxxG-CTERM domain-containing protein n=2 Tax=Paenibacillus albicereus TaxID=2726185 RepID=A0A6H2H3U2_9BACL|nr:WGxxGxxG-CTERM domain-containing protein [Paenibacillus albicereus]
MTSLASVAVLASMLSLPAHANVKDMTRNIGQNLNPASVTNDVERGVNRGMNGLERGVNRLENDMDMNRGRMNTNGTMMNTNTAGYRAGSYDGMAAGTYRAQNAGTAGRYTAASAAGTRSNAGWGWLGLLGLFGLAGLRSRNPERH